MSLAMTREEREQFLADVHIGVLSVDDPEGRGPLTCPVWYAYEPGGEIVFVTGRSSKKAQCLGKATRASFLVQTEQIPYKYVSIEGPVTVADADLDKHVRPIAHRYLGPEGGDAYLEMSRAEGNEEDVLVTIRPERWLTVDYAKRFPS